MLSFRRAAAALVLVLLATTACASTASKLGARFSRERGCPEDRVRVRETDGVVYRVAGCGQSAEYVCPSFASADSNARNCEERGQPRARSAEPQAVRPRAGTDPEPPPR
jgi:hypothetical protein